jgi:hypothetical protein
MISFSYFYSPTVMIVKGFSHHLWITYSPFKFTDSLIPSISALSKSSCWKNYSFWTLSRRKLITLPLHFTFSQSLNYPVDFVRNFDTSLLTVFMGMQCLSEKFAHSNEWPRIIFLENRIFSALPMTSLSPVFNYLSLRRLQIRHLRP